MTCRDADDHDDGQLWGMPAELRQRRLERAQSRAPGSSIRDRWPPHTAAVVESRMARVPAPGRWGRRPVRPTRAAPAIGPAPAAAAAGRVAAAGWCRERG